MLLLKNQSYFLKRLIHWRLRVLLQDILVMRASISKLIISSEYDAQWGQNQNKKLPLSKKEEAMNLNKFGLRPNES